MAQDPETREPGAFRGRRYDRVVVSVHRADEGGAAISVGVALAGLLRVDLQAIVLEDPAMLALAQVPGIREYRPHGRGWQAIDLPTLNQALDMQARRFERRLRDVAAAARVAVRCERLRRSAGEALPGLSRDTDVLVVAEPADPAERVGEAFRRFLHAATASSASVLLVPRRVARATGPVLALAAADTDPAVAIGGELAQLAGERLVIARMPSPLSGGHAGPRPHGMVPFPEVAERLVVAVRGAGDTGEAFLEIAGARRVPLLLLARPPGE